MKRVLVFAGSNSKKSINKELAVYATSFLKDKQVEILDLNDYPLAIYGIDEEIANGIPENAQRFFSAIQKSDGIILSLAEHNGNFAAVFKNLYDWLSRIESKVWQNKPMLLMATSPGGRGGASVLQIAKNGFPYMGGNIVSEFSLPKFQENFDQGVIKDDHFLTSLQMAVQTLEESI